MKTILITILAMLTLFTPSPGNPGEGRGEGLAKFQYVDVFIDAHGKPLAAYQFELAADAQTTQIVGVEGGDSTAFKSAPYYDPAALSHNRIIIAAFNTGTDLPNAKTRVARLHMRTTGQPDYRITLTTAAGSDATKLAADISFEQGHAP